MTETLEQLKRRVEARHTGMNRRWNEIDAEPDWIRKSDLMRTSLFIGTQSALISAQQQYIVALEEQLKGEKP